MFGKAFDRISSHVTIWTWVYGSGILSAAIVTGFVAKATSWINPWGPIGWWVAALLGALIAAALFALSAKGYHLLTNARIAKKIYGAEDRLNPMLPFYESLRIKLQDLVLPERPIVKGKTFRRCDLIGPCNFMVLNHTTLSHCGMTNVQAVLIRKTSIPFVVHNAIGFDSCDIQYCDLYNITFFVQEDLYESINAGMKGITWLTYTPSGFSSINPRDVPHQAAEQQGMP